MRDHYKPQGPNDAVPTAPVTVAVALADKLDQLVGFFAIDERPTGSKDPYALRRAALGVIRIVLETQARLPLETFTDAAARTLFVSLVDGFNLSWRASDFPEGTDYWQVKESAKQRWREFFAELRFSKNDVRAEDLVNEPGPLMVITKHEGFRLPPIGELQASLFAFFADRLKVLLRDQGRRHDLVDAVFALGDDDLVRIVARVEALSAFLATEDGANLLAGYKRAVNILRAEAKKTGDTPEGAPDPAAFTADEERALHAAAEAAAPQVEAALGAEDFAAAMTHLAALRAPVDAFFDRVLVNDPDPAVRLNRLRLLGQVRDLMNRVADFSLVAG